MPDPGEQPKIIIDSDWKSQAQAEKERLAQKESEQAAKKPAGARGPHDMPPADFRTLVGSLATQALLYLGAFPDPETGRAVVAFDLAQHYIDLLGLLETKTKGNLTKDEEGELTGVLQELRMRFVEILDAVAKADKEGALRKSAGPMSPGSPAST